MEECSRLEYMDKVAGHCMPCESLCRRGPQAAAACSKLCSAFLSHLPRETTTADVTPAAVAHPQEVQSQVALVSACLITGTVILCILIPVAICYIIGKRRFKTLVVKVNVTLKKNPTKTDSDKTERLESHPSSEDSGIQEVESCEQMLDDSNDTVSNSEQSRLIANEELSQSSEHYRTRNAGSSQNVDTHNTSQDSGTDVQTVAVVESTSSEESDDILTDARRDQRGPASQAPDTATRPEVQPAPASQASRRQIHDCQIAHRPSETPDGVHEDDCIGEDTPLKECACSEDKTPLKQLSTTTVPQDSCRDESSSCVPTFAVRNSGSSVPSLLQSHAGLNLDETNTTMSDVSSNETSDGTASQIKQGSHHQGSGISSTNIYESIVIRQEGDNSSPEEEQGPEDTVMKQVSGDERDTPLKVTVIETHIKQPDGEATHHKTLIYTGSCQSDDITGKNTESQRHECVKERAKSEEDFTDFTDEPSSKLQVVECNSNSNLSNSSGLGVRRPHSSGYQSMPRGQSDEDTRDKQTHQSPQTMPEATVQTTVPTTQKTGGVTSRPPVQTTVPTAQTTCGVTSRPSVHTYAGTSTPSVHTSAGNSTPSVAAVHKSRADVFLLIETNATWCPCIFDDEDKMEVQVSFDKITYNDAVKWLVEKTGWDEIDFRIREYMPSKFESYGPLAGQGTFSSVSTQVSEQHPTKIGCYMTHKNTGELYALSVAHSLAEGAPVFVDGSSEAIGECVEVQREKKEMSMDLAIIKLNKGFSRSLSKSQLTRLRFPHSEQEAEERLLYRSEVGPVLASNATTPAYFRHARFTDKAHGIYRARTCVRISEAARAPGPGDCGSLLLTAPPLNKRANDDSLMVLGMVVGKLTQEAEDGGDAPEYYITLRLQEALEKSHTFAGPNYDFFPTSNPST